MSFGLGYAVSVSGVSSCWVGCGVSRDIDHPEAAILLGMGLGKSVITLTAIWQLMLDYFTVSRVLVVAPLRVARDTWLAEVAKWDHLRGLTVAVAVGTKQDRLAALAKSAMVTIINRENIPWLVNLGLCASC